MLLRGVLDGDRRARDRLVHRLQPIFEAVVRVALRKWRGGRIDDRDDEDIINDIWARLFEEDCRALRTWDLKRSSLESLGRGFAKWRVDELQRKVLGRFDLFGRPVSEDETPDVQDPERPDELVVVRDLAQRILECVEQKFTTDLGRRMVRLLLREGRSTDDVVRITGMSRQRVFRWRSRLLSAARECWERITGASA